MAEGAAERTAVDVDGVFAFGFARRCRVWTTTVEAHRAAEGYVRRHGFVIGEQQLLDEVLFRLFDLDHRRPGWFDRDEFVTRDPAPYCRTIMRNVLIDLQRGHARDVFGLDEDEVSRRSRRGPGRVDDGSGEHRGTANVGDVESLDELRVAVEYSGHPPTVVSSVLTVCVLSVDPEADVAESPSPRAGSAPDQAILWPALWFAGHRAKAFPTRGESTAAQRKFRSNHGRAIRSAIESCVARTRWGTR